PQPRLTDPSPEPSRVMIKKPAPMAKATNAATIRDQKVLRLRAATRNSRSTMGKKIAIEPKSFELHRVRRGLQAASDRVARGGGLFGLAGDPDKVRRLAVI